MTYSEPGGTQHISIHALREESDSGGFLCAIISPIFLSTPSARRATENGLRTSSWPHISIHALREEGDVTEIKQGEYLGISIHALREEGDCKNGEKHLRFCFIIKRSAQIWKSFSKNIRKKSRDLHRTA